MRRTTSLLAAGISAALTAAALATAGPAGAAGPDGAAAPARHCARQAAVTVPGAERTDKRCVDDLTTAGLPAGLTDPADYAGLAPAGAVHPTGVPGIQVDGYFPDTSTTNTNHGWAHDSQFVLRLPDRWNGGLVVTGAPGVREQYANDQIISDFVLAQGYAFASTDKGNTGATFFTDGAAPGDAVVEWHDRVTQLTRASKAAVASRYGRAPARTYMTGISNGGYLTRWQLENRPELYDGGVDWEGTLFRAAGPNVLTYLPPVLRAYPRYRDAAEGSREKQAAYEALIRAGLTPGSEFLWQFHYDVYWDLTQRIYREEFDPTYDGRLLAGKPYCQPPATACDTGYRYHNRPQAVRDAIRRIELTGRIGRPMLTLHGTLDALLPIRTDSDVYATLVATQGRAARHRYYIVEQGTHVDALYDAFPDRLRPILPCYRTAFGALTRWVESGTPPPPSGFIAKPRSGDVVNTCSLR